MRDRDYKVTVKCIQLKLGLMCYSFRLDKIIFQTKIDLTACGDEICKEEGSGGPSGCFCPETKVDAPPAPRESETETLVMILVIIYA